jgi:hypothetical protein
MIRIHSEVNVTPGSWSLPVWKVGVNVPAVPGGTAANNINGGIKFLGNRLCFSDFTQRESSRR